MTRQLPKKVVHTLPHKVSVQLLAFAFVFVGIKIKAKTIHNKVFNISHQKAEWFHNLSKPSSCLGTVPPM